MTETCLDRFLFFQLGSPETRGCGAVGPNSSSRRSPALVSAEHRELPPKMDASKMEEAVIYQCLLKVDNTLATVFQLKTKCVNISKFAGTRGVPRVANLKQHDVFRFERSLTSSYRIGPVSYACCCRISRYFRCLNVSVSCRPPRVWRPCV